MAANEQDIQESSESQALISAEQIDAKHVFGEGRTDKVLAFIRDQIPDVVVDVQTTAGRAELRSLAYKIRRSKTVLDDVGKQFAADLKATVKAIDTNRKTLRDSLDTLHDEIRRPLTEYEEAEKARAADVARWIENIRAAGVAAGTTPAAEIRERIARVKAIECTETCFDERAGEAAQQKDIALRNLERALEAEERREAEAAELARLRQEAIDREKREAEERREREAEERGRIMAENAARAEREAAERQALEAQRAAEKRAAAAEFDLQQAREKQEREKAAEEARRQDRERRATVHTAIVQSLVDWADLPKDEAETVMTLIVSGRIPNVSVRY